MKRKRKKRGRRGSSFGRLLEGAGVVLLVLVVLLFGVSIAARVGGDEEPRVEPARGSSSGGAGGGLGNAVRVPHGTADFGEAAGATGAQVPDYREWKERPTVDIRNGCGVAGMAEQMMRQFRRAGFDVVEYRNADRYDYATTLVLDRAGKPGGAERVLDWMQSEFGVGERVEARVPIPGADVQIILGADLADTLRMREARGL